MWSEVYKNKISIFTSREFMKLEFKKDLNIQEKILDRPDFQDLCIMYEWVK